MRRVWIAMILSLGLAGSLGAAKIEFAYPSGSTLYTIIRKPADATVWNGAAWESWADGNIGTYDIPLADGSGQYYRVDFPAGIAAGTYTVSLYLQAGGSPAVSDLLLGSGSMAADGYAEVRTAAIANGVLGQVGDKVVADMDANSVPLGRIGDPNASDTLAADLAVIEAMVDALEGRIGTPAVTIAQDIADSNSVLHAHIGDPNSGDSLAGDLAVLEAMVDAIEGSVADWIWEELITDHDDTPWSAGWLLRMLAGKRDD